MLRIVIIGAGFSGTVVLYNLVNGMPEQQSVGFVEIAVFEKSGEIGGLAYRDSNPDCLITNVVIAKMSAFSDQPLHLLEWLQKKGYQHKKSSDGTQRAYRATDYCPRRYYGEYIRHLFETAKEIAKKKNIKVIVKMNSEVTAVNFTENSLMCDNQQHVFTKIIFATGNTTNIQTPDFLRKIKEEHRYISGVLKSDFFQRISTIPVNETIVIFGTGLSAMDIILLRYNLIKRALINNCDATLGKIVLCSRHGLLHEPYRKGQTTTDLEKFIAVHKDIPDALPGRHGNHDNDISEIRSLIDLSHMDAYRFREDRQKGYSTLRQKFRSVVTRELGVTTHEDHILNDIVGLNTQPHLETMATGMPYRTGRIIAKLTSMGLIEIIQTDNHSFLIDKGTDAYRIVINHQTIKCGWIINCSGANFDYATEQPYKNLQSSILFQAHEKLPRDILIDSRGHMLSEARRPITSTHCIGALCSSSLATRGKPFSTIRSIVSLKKHCLSTARIILKELAMPGYADETVDYEAHPQVRFSQDTYKQSSSDGFFYSLLFNLGDPKNQKRQKVHSDIIYGKSLYFLSFLKSATYETKFMYFSFGEIRIENFVVTYEKCKLSNCKLVAEYLVMTGAKLTLVETKISFTKIKNNTSLYHLKGSGKFYKVTFEFDDSIFYLDSKIIENDFRVEVVESQIYIFADGELLHSQCLFFNLPNAVLPKTTLISHNPFIFEYFHTHSACSEAGPILDIAFSNSYS